MSQEGPAIKRYRRVDGQKKSDDDESEEEDNYTPYIPVRERKKQQLMKLGRIVQLTNEDRQVGKSSSENEHDSDVR